MEDFSYQRRFFLPEDIFSIHGRFSPLHSWQIFLTMGDFSYNKRFILRWEIFPFMEDFSYIPWEISLAKKESCRSSSKKDCSLREILFTRGDFICYGRQNLSLDVQFGTLYFIVVSLWLVVYLGRMI